MKIVHRNFVYEAVGKVYTEQDIQTILEESGVSSLSQLHALLEAIEDKNKKMDEEEPNPDDVPDLQPTPEEKEIEDKQQAAQTPQEAPVAPAAPEGGSEVPPIETEPEIPAETPVEEPAPEPSVEPAPASMPAEKKADKEQVPAKPLPIKEPPMVPPSKDVPEVLEKTKEVPYLRKLSTLYNNFVRFFKKPTINAAGTIIGLNAAGIKNDSKFLQGDITAFVQGTAKEPYSVWVRLFRKRTTQDFSFNSMSQVRCSCPSFIFYASHNDLNHKVLLGRPIVNKKVKDARGNSYTIDMRKPSPINNPDPNNVLMCKHIANVVREAGRKGLLADFTE